MKSVLYLFATIVLIGCKSKTEKETPVTDASEEIKTEVIADAINTRVPDEEDGGEMLLGEINCKGLQAAPFKEWFTENYNAHTIDAETLATLQPLLKDVTIKTFMGTWCEDSQREVPALFKILDQSNFDEESIDLIAMTHDKTTPQEFEKDLTIEYVPTIIFYKNGKELNRIVEYPNGSLEQDIRTILEEKPYKHAYAD